MRAPLLVAALLLAAQAEEPLEGGAATKDSYSNTPKGAHTQTASRRGFASNAFLITHDGWLTSATVSTSVPPAGVTVTLIVNGHMAAPGTIDARGAGGVVQRRPVDGLSRVPVASGDVVTLNATAGAAPYKASIVNGSWLALDFVVTRLTPWVTVSNDDGRGATVSSYSFASQGLDTSGVPPKSTLVAYAALTDIWSGSLKSGLYNASDSALVVSWLQAGDGRSGVRWTTVGVAAAVSAGWPTPLEPLSVRHTSLQTNRLYSAGVTAAGRTPTSAIGSVTFRLPGPFVPLGTDDGAGASSTAVSFSSGALGVPNDAPGFLRAVDLRTDAPSEVTCTAVVTVVSQPGRGPGVVTGSLPFLNNGAGAEAWRSLPLPSPLAVPGGSAVSVKHSCGGQSYAAAVRQDDGAAVVALRIDTFVA